MPIDPHHAAYDSPAYDSPVFSQLQVEQLWLSFKQPAVRELAFAIASPPLLHQWPNEQPDFSIALPDAQFWHQQLLNYWPRLQELEQNPQPLQAYLQRLRSTRLGIRFEQLLAFWLEDDAYHPFKLLGHSIKRMDGQRTLGEIDFLIKNRLSGEIEHWEVAIKFYLGEAQLMTDQWLGLNRNDSLGRKIRHLCQRQFAVDQIEGQTIQRRRAIVKGRLFYPAYNPLDLPQWIAQPHLTGLWGSHIPATPDQHYWRRASRDERMVVQQDMPNNQANDCSPRYWTNGLYFLLDTENKVVLQYMLRITDKMHQSIKNGNILILNPYA